ncbi:MAG: hypothetical protein EU540_01845 [Promethearchaeota archaeon]|nr:MAG: hypothetical protein EU540_01845 [Candidatus Lokiarchaeota archaeon]
MNLLQIVNGLSSLILVVIFIVVGISIALKYKKTKERMYLFFGITWIGVVEAYIAVSISFIVALFNNDGLPEPIYFLVGISFYPVSTLIWITAFTDIIYKKAQKIFQLIFIIIGTVFEIIFFSLLFTAPSLIGTLLSPVDSEYGLVVRIYIYFSLVVIFFTGIIFAIYSIKSNNPEYRLRGIFIIITLITFVIGAILDTLELDLIFLTLVRLIMISSAVEFYIAFVMPKWVKKLFLKES